MKPGEALELLLARLLVDDQTRARFIADPASEARRAGLAEDEQAAVMALDPDALALAAGSFARKRSGRVYAAGPLARVRLWWQRVCRGSQGSG